MSSKTIPPSPPNPHIAVMATSVDTRLQPQYVTSPTDEIKQVNFPYNLVNEFTITCYSKYPAKEGDNAVLYDSDGKLLSTAPLNSGEALTFENCTFYALNVKFRPEHTLSSQVIKVTLPLELFGTSGGFELNFRFGNFVEPDPVY